MFSGIVQKLGVVAALETCDFGRVLHVDPGGWGHHPAPGDSISVNGVCLTVTHPAGTAAVDPSSPLEGRLRFDVIRQTLDVTTLGNLCAGDAVNLEPALTPTGLMSGHLVQGHVDGVGVVRRVLDDPTERRLHVEPPPALLDYIVEKGSIAVDGVSMTVAGLGETWFEIALIPTTIEITTLGRVREGSLVNLETDYIVKAVVHWMRRQREERD
ncbi:MAG: riboflavin synthase [Planctomycetota bacterium]|jgi:riboflavin synthase